MMGGETTGRLESLAGDVPESNYHLSKVHEGGREKRVHSRYLEWKSPKTSFEDLGKGKKAVPRTQ